MFIVQFLLIIWIGALGFAQISFGDLQTEKKVTLVELINEAYENSLEVREAQIQEHTVNFRKSAARSPFFPEIGLEGGYETWQSSQGFGQGVRGGFGYLFGKYNLFKGGEDKYRLLVRTKEEEYSALAVKQTQAKVSREVASHFYELLYFDEAIFLHEDALSLNATQSSKVEKRVRSGLISNTDILEFKLRDAILRSQLLFLKQERNISEQDLARILGRHLTSPLYVQGKLALALTPKFDTEKMLKTATQQRLDLREAQKDFEVASLKYNTSLAAWLPQLNLEGHFGYLRPTEREVQGIPSSALILKLTVPLFSGWGPHHERKANFAEMARAEMKSINLSLQVRNQIKVAEIRLRTLQERLELENKNLDLTQKYYEITLSEYNRGVKNSPDLAGATEKLFESKRRILELQKDLQLMRLQLAEKIGTGAESLF